MLLTFCSCSCRRHRLRSLYRLLHLLVVLLLLCLEAWFSAAEERSAMSGKFQEELDEAMLTGLFPGRPRAALCMRFDESCLRSFMETLNIWICETLL
ncbi:probable G-protein coupled receptor 63 isoform X2 [Sciurus carolinensis]|uniref:probable G-protein coupled receptor 63 isoform X2 n=1 Tax=Sciurus carolinensis TaxID=30640 RepID=UPI001FB1FCEF|nr:probable G-protein coupled receptor 63 isoform X2 [Sciurus carolinensis]